MTDLPEPEHDPGEVRDLADEILAGDEFADHASLLERAGRWVFDRLDDLFGGSGPTVDGGGGGGANVVAWVVMIALGVLVAYLAVRLVRRLPGHARAGGDGDAVDVDVERRASPAAWADAAAALEADGRWKEGLRARYRGLVTTLVDDGVLEAAPGRTAGEYRHDVDDRLPSVAPEFGGATELFERAWYGDWPTGAEEAERFRRLAGRVSEVIGS